MFAGFDPGSPLLDQAGAATTRSGSPGSIPARWPRITPSSASVEAVKGAVKSPGFFGPLKILILNIVNMQSIILLISS